MSADPQVAVREGEAKAARERLMTTVAAIKDRISPPNVAHRVVEDAKVKALAAVDDGVEIARLHPAKVGAGIAAVVLLLLRRPLWRLVRGRPNTE